MLRNGTRWKQLVHVQSSLRGRHGFDQVFLPSRIGLFLFASSHKMNRGIPHVVYRRTCGWKGMASPMKRLSTGLAQV